VTNLFKKERIGGLSGHQDFSLFSTENSVLHVPVDCTLLPVLSGFVLPPEELTAAVRVQLPGLFAADADRTKLVHGGTPEEIQERVAISQAMNEKEDEDEGGPAGPMLNLMLEHVVPDRWLTCANGTRAPDARRRQQYLSHSPPFRQLVFCGARPLLHHNKQTCHTTPLTCCMISFQG
jgi:hypothetical protein